MVPLLRRAARVGALLLLAFVALSVAQVLWVRFLPPLTTATIESRRLGSIFTGGRWSIERKWVGQTGLKPRIPSNCNFICFTRRMI